MTIIQDENGTYAMVGFECEFGFVAVEGRFMAISCPAKMQLDDPCRISYKSPSSRMEQEAIVVGKYTNGTVEVSTNPALVRPIVVPESLAHIEGANYLIRNAENLTMPGYPPGSTIRGCQLVPYELLKEQQ